MDFSVNRETMKAVSNSCLTALLIISLWLAGCAEWGYRHMNDPSRDAWQKPQQVVERLDIEPGARVADLGAGGGYFTWYLAAAVGPRGKVYAVEIDETALAIIEKEMKSRGATNVVPIRAEPGDAKIPEPVDLVFSCDTYHHMKNRVAYFRSLARYLKPDGKVAILDFHAEGFFSGLLGHGTTKEEVRREMESAGYRLTADYNLIDRQHFQMFSRTDLAQATAFLPPRAAQSYSLNTTR
jgi:predicted methyltransferase